MSSTSIRKCQVTDIDLLGKAIDGLAKAKRGNISGHRYGVQLPCGSYVTFDTKNGTMSYDVDYSNDLFWSDVNKLLQGYSKEVCRQFAASQGARIEETQLPSGECQVQIILGEDTLLPTGGGFDVSI